MGDIFSIAVKIVLVFFAVILGYRMYFVIKQIVSLSARKKAADTLRKKLDVFSVESEVLSFAEKRLSRLDTEYDVSVSYEIDGITYYKDLIIFNRGSLRIGQKIILLCDNEDFNNAVVQNGEEEEALKRLIFKLIWLIVELIIDFIGMCFDGRELVGEYNRAGLGTACILIFGMIFEKIFGRLESE